MQELARGTNGTGSVSVAVDSLVVNSFLLIHFPDGDAIGRNVIHC